MIRDTVALAMVAMALGAMNVSACVVTTYALGEHTVEGRAVVCAVRHVVVDGQAVATLVTGGFSGTVDGVAEDYAELRMTIEGAGQASCWLPLGDVTWFARFSGSGEGQGIA